jgi:hypothetical protein
MFHMDISKVDRGVAHAAMAPVASGQRPTAGFRLLPRAFLAQRTSPSPLPPIPSLPSISGRSFSSSHERAESRRWVGVAAAVGAGSADECAELRTSDRRNSRRGAVGQT